MRTLFPTAMLAIGAMCLVAGTATAEPDKEKGWFFYDDPPVIEEEETQPEPDEEPEVAVAEPPDEPEDELPGEDEGAEDDGPAPFSMQWIREHFPKARLAAMNDPDDPEKMRAYLYMNKLMFDKSSRFAHKSRAMALSDPVLDVNSEMPWNAIGRTQHLRAKEAGRKRALEHLADTSGLWFFFDGKCRYCKLQVPLLNRVAERYGFTVFNISVDGSRIEGLKGKFRVDKGHAKRFKISSVPAIMLVTPPDSYVVVGQGMLGVAEIENRLIIGATHKGLLPDELLDEANPGRDNILTAEAIKDAEKALADSDDPGEWVSYIRRSLGYETGD